MNSERLLRLADFLSSGEIDPDRFDMTDWTNMEVSEERPLGSCGTAGCAVGWACTLPDFIAAGLTLRQDDDEPPTPSFEGYDGWTAVARFFDITWVAGESLFMTPDGVDEDEDETPLDVATRIREFVRNYA